MWTYGICRQGIFADCPASWYDVYTQVQSAYVVNLLAISSPDL